MIDADDAQWWLLVAFHRKNGIRKCAVLGVDRDRVVGIRRVAADVAYHGQLAVGTA